jgi:hypothetical protein
VANEGKDAWEKTEIILSPIGGLLTALAVAAVGFLGTRYLNSRQESDTRQRVYAELMSKREEADVGLRKDMFNSIIGTFLKPTSAQPQQDVLKLELLAYNFHDSLDLGPLFKQVYRQIDSDVRDKLPYLERLQRVADVVSGKQVSALKEAGNSQERPVDLKEFDQHPEGIMVYEGDMRMPFHELHDGQPLPIDNQPRHFVLDLVKADSVTKEINVRLRVSALGSNDVTDSPEVDKSFWVGFFDFPMIDNTRLSHDQRCAVVLNEFDPGSKFAEVTVVYFPGDRTSLKEKPYYDEVLHSLRRAQESSASSEK